MVVVVVAQYPWIITVVSTVGVFRMGIGGRILVGTSLTGADQLFKRLVLLEYVGDKLKKVTAKQLRVAHLGGLTLQELFIEWSECMLSDPRR